MASPKTEKTNDPGSERVRLFVPLDKSNEDPNLFIGVNGVNYILPRGKYSEVPKFVADEYNRSLEAEAVQSARINAKKIKPEK